jgi:hypothetical protein
MNTQSVGQSLNRSTYQTRFIDSETGRIYRFCKRAKIGTAVSRREVVWDDYWFGSDRQDGKIFNEHFALK